MSSHDAPLDQAAVLAALRAGVARLEDVGRAQHRTDALPVCEDLPLPGGDLARAAVREVLAILPGCGTAFCAVLLARTRSTAVIIRGDVALKVTRKPKGASTLAGPLIRRPVPADLVVPGHAVAVA
jgi:hypothetical protein